MKRILASILLMALVCAAGCAISSSSQRVFVPGTKAEFEAKYKQWNLALEKWQTEHRLSSIIPVLPEERAIISMGASAVPFLIEKLEGKSGNITRKQNCDLCVVKWITGKGFQTSEYAPGKYGDSEEETRLYIRWWREGRRQTPARFAALHSKWNSLMKRGKKADAQKTLDEIRCMGIDALPLIMAKIQGGDDRLVPLVSRIMRKDVGGNRQQVLAWWKANEAGIRLPDPKTTAEGARKN